MSAKRRMRVNPATPQKRGCKPKLDSLTPEQRQTVIDWMLEDRPYSWIAPQVLAQFGLKTSTAALSNFFHTHCTPLLTARPANTATLRVGGLLVEINVRPDPDPR